ncbi:TPA: hypothetical protein QHM50_002665 [Morganella morganii subsp. morganii]|nr:hypothetical protein [Morganella morganii]HDT3151250.1 hypothetical protein [Morganella morganii subsp. morganii]
MTTITTANNTKQVYSPEIDSIISVKKDLQEINIDPEVIKEITKNNSIKSTEVTDEQISAEIRTRAGALMPSLLSVSDQKWMKLAIELCKVLNDDSLSQQERQNKLDVAVIELAKELKNMKYKEAELQVKAAVTGALVSIGISIVGAAMSIKGIDVANPMAPTPGGIAGQAMSGLSQPVSQVFVQFIQKQVTELQGDAEVVRAQKDLKLKSGSVHGKASNDAHELNKKVMDMFNRYLDNKQATSGNLLNNMRT